MKMERNLRKTRVGKVVSDKMDKTIVVAIEDNIKHPKYGKIEALPQITAQYRELLNHENKEA